MTWRLGNKIQQKSIYIYNMKVSIYDTRTALIHSVFQIIQGKVNLFGFFWCFIYKFDSNYQFF